MRIDMPAEMAAAYASPSQRARVVSESWATENLYCPCCEADRLQASRANTKALDYTCLQCRSPFQLKASRSPFAKRVLDGAYTALRDAILANNTPSLFLLHYEREQWIVKNLTLIPWFAVTLSCVETRRPLSTTAERAGWVGCNILLCNIPIDARLPIIADGKARKPSDVRRELNSLKPIAALKPIQRGWMLDVLNTIRALRKEEFSLEELYAAAAAELQALHPNNRHVTAKIRQQLQRLRDFGYLRFLTPGSYRLVQKV